MKDLIAKLKSDANVALGAIWLYIDAQEKRIAELEQQLQDHSAQAFGIGETYANALSRIAELEAQIAAGSAPADTDIPEALELLAAVFDAWENGDDCYEDPEECAGFLGKAFRLDDDIFNRCVELLNRRNPPRNAAPQPADTDKLREAFEAAWPEIYKAGMDHGWRGIAWASWQACVASTALQAPVREAPGYKLVPIDPTPEMMAQIISDCDCADCIKRRYNAMLAVSPLLASPVREVPGWKLVPIEPTDAQLATLEHPDAAMRRVYKAMLAAAPLPAAPVQTEGGTP